MILHYLAIALLTLVALVYLGLAVFMVARWWQTRPATPDRQPAPSPQRRWVDEGPAQRRAYQRIGES